MITINLLPEELRVVPKKSVKHSNIRPLLIGAAVVFGILTLFFFVDFILSSVRLHKIDVEWKALEPQALELGRLQHHIEGVLKPERDFLISFAGADRPLTYLMMWASEFLPDTAWLTELQLVRTGEGGNLLLKGVALPAKQKSSIEQIEGFLHQLKAKIPDATLSLTTTRQQVQGTELTQFTANYEWGKLKKP